MTKARQKPLKSRQEARRRESQAQAKRNPMLQVRVPQSLYTQLQKMAKQDYRSLADWLRLHLGRMVQNGITFNGAAPLPQSADAVDPHAGSTGTPTPRGLHLGPTFVDDLRIDK